MALQYQIHISTFKVKNITCKLLYSFPQVFYYFFAIIGMESFQGLITYYGYNETTKKTEQLWCGNAALQNTTFYRLHYCSNNFNDILKSFVLLFELMVVNQWHDILWAMNSFFMLATQDILSSYLMNVFFNMIKKN